LNWSLTPPLIALMEGRKVRPRKERVPAPKELRLHFPVAKLLREHCNWEWTHFPAGEKRDANTATKLKQMGLKPGWPDFILINPRGLAHFMELKRLGGELTFEQDEFRIRCIARGNPYEVCWTIDQCLLAFERWGCLRVSYQPGRAD